MSELSPPFHLSVDVGGTFTDLSLVDTAGVSSVLKVPSVPSDPAKGVLNAVQAAAQRLGVPTASMLEHVERFVHGSTVATNAILEHKLANVGLLTTAGFRDTLEIRRGIRFDQWDHRAPWPTPMVPRYRRVGIGGRIDAQGVEVEPLDLDAVRSQCDAWDGVVDAVAICFLHSYANPSHEAAAAEIVRERWPGGLTSVSSELVPTLGEYARTSTTVANAALFPNVGGYLHRLAQTLAEWGLRTPVLMLQSNGGTVPLHAASQRPVQLALSGPAAVVGALHDVASTLDDPAGGMVSMEIGGTSCDVAVMVDGSVGTQDGLVVGGYHLAVQSVDVHTVGAGGGTLAWVDGSGLLHMGPQGAGAEPGPACYQRGGMHPTATDAQLVLGRLRPGPYAGGSVELSLEAAEAAIATHVGEPLGLSIDHAAQGMLAILEQHLRAAVETITIERGRDPRRLDLVAAGGAGGFHGSAIGQALGCRRVVVPAEAGVFCANGMMASNLRLDHQRAVAATISDAVDPSEQLSEALRVAVDEARAAAASIWSDSVTERVTRATIEVRYPGQLWAVSVPVDADSFVEAAKVREVFEAEYDRLYGHVQPGGELVVSSVGASVEGVLDPVVRRQLDAAPTPRPKPASTRSVWFPDRWCETPIFDGAQLRAGHRINGPFVIEAATTTIVGYPGDECVVGSYGELVIEKEAA